MSSLRSSTIRLLLLPCALVAIASARAWAQGGETSDPPKIQRAGTESYQDMLRKVKETDSGVNYKEFRLAYAESAEYKPGADPEIRQAMFGALSAKDHARAAELAGTILKDRYVDIYAHQVAAVAYRALGDRGKATLHGSMARELVRSIVESGDGQAPERVL